MNGFIVVYGEYASAERVQIFVDEEGNNRVFDSKEEAERQFKEVSSYPHFILNW